MTIDIDRLMRFPPPAGRQVLTARDIAFYALSIGIGRDPLDLRRLDYVDPLRGPRVMPAMVLVMAHPGFWMGDPGSGVDPKAVLHATQGFEILAPLPAEGEVTSTTRVTGVVDKGPGKAGMILTETDLSDATGTLFARLRRNTFIRGGGGFGGSVGAAPEPEPPAPQGPPDHVVDLETGSEQALVYRLNGDLNPLHSDPALARGVGFDRPILQGLCTMGVVSHAVLRALGGYRAETLRSLRLRFTSPVYPGETIRTEIWNGGGFRALVPARDTVVTDGGLALFGAPAPQPGTRSGHA